MIQTKNVISGILVVILLLITIVTASKAQLTGYNAADQANAIYRSAKETFDVANSTYQTAFERIGYAFGINTQYVNNNKIDTLAAESELAIAKNYLDLSWSQLVNGIEQLTIDNPDTAKSLFTSAQNNAQSGLTAANDALDLINNAISASGVEKTTANTLSCNAAWGGEFYCDVGKEYILRHYVDEKCSDRWYKYRYCLSGCNLSSGKECKGDTGYENVKLPKVLEEGVPLIVLKEEVEPPVKTTETPNSTVNQTPPIVKPEGQEALVKDSIAIKLDKNLIILSLIGVIVIIGLIWLVKSYGIVVHKKATESK